MSATNLATYLDQRVKALGLSKSEAARRADVSRQTWYRLLNAEIGDAKLSTLIRLAEALETTPLHILRIYFGEEIFTETRRLATADNDCCAQA